MAELESELLEWQKKVKALESGKRAQADEYQRIVANQRSMIEKLRQENKRTQQELSADSKGLGLPSTQQQGRIDKLYELVDTYQRKVEIESRQLDYLHQELDIYQAKAEELRKGNPAAVVSQKQTSKHVQVLENRLEQAEKKFNETLAKNKELHQDINNLNKQHAALEQVFQKLDRELAAKKADIAALQEAMAVAVAARMTAVQAAQVLRSQADKEQAAFADEARELALAREADQKLLEAQTQRIQRVLGAADSLEQQGRAVLPELGEAGFEEAAAQLQEVSGIQGLEQLVQHFTCLEAANFEAFNACNRANEQIASLHKELRAAQGEARQVQMEGVVAKQKDVIRQTLAKRDQANRRAESLKEKQAAMERRLAIIRAGTSSVLRALGGSPTPVNKSDPLDVQFTTLAGNMGMLEVRARAVVAVWSVAVGKSAMPPGGGGQLMAMGQESTAKAAAAATSSGSSKDSEAAPAAPTPASAPAPQAFAAVAGSKEGRLPAVAAGMAAAGAAAGVPAGSGMRLPERQHMQSPISRGAGGQLIADTEGEEDEEEDDDDEVPLTREQIQARASFKAAIDHAQGSS